MTEDEWKEILHFITEGGVALHQYDEFRKVEIMEGGLYKINSRRIAMRHRLHIGTIVSDAMLKVRFITGGYVWGSEGNFISPPTPRECFSVVRGNPEIGLVEGMTALCRKR